MTEKDMPAMTLKKIRKNAWRAFKRAFLYDTRPSEFWSICFLLWWAVLLAGNSSTFLSSPGFAYIAKVAPQSGWSAVCFSLALMHIMGLVFDWFQLRRFCCFIIAFFWVSVSVLIFAANPVSTGTGVYGIISLSMLWVFWRGPHNNHITYIDYDDQGNLVKRVV